MAITTAERTAIIELTVMMFNAAPGATYLAQIVALYEANPGTQAQKLEALANQLSQTAVYNSLHPNFETAEEFAADFLTPLGLQNDAVARDFVIAKFNAGVSKGQIVYEGYAALNAVPADGAAQYVVANAILNNKTTVAEYYSVTKDGAATDLSTLQTVVGSVTEDPASVTAAEAAIDNQVISGQTFTLTTGVDTITGTAGNDTINGTNLTATGLDSISAAAGTDTFNFNDVAGGTDVGGLVSMDSVEHVVVRSTGLATVTGTSWTGVQNLSVLQGTSATVVAGSTTAVDVSGVTGAVAVNGGSSVGVASATTNAAVTIGATTVPTGAVSVSHTKQGTGAIAIDGGTSVDVTTAGVTTGTVSIGAGGATTDLPSGAVAVNSTGAASVAATDVTLGAIAVNGGSGVTVAQTATSSSAAAAADTVGATITQSAVTVTGSAATTSATVTQSAPVAEVLGVTAVAGSKETNVLTFAAVTAGGTVTVDGLTFTAAKDLTAAQVAAAFANLSAGATQGSAPAGNGVYSGTLTAGWTSGAVVVSGTNQTVTVSSTTNTDAVDLVVGGTVPPTVAKTDGVTAVAAKAGVLGVAGGVVVVNGAIAGTDVLSNVALAGYASATVTSDALTALSLANSNGAVTVNNTAATTLGLSLSGVGTQLAGADAALNLGGTYTTLNIAATGADSAADITAGGVTAVNVSGDKAVDLTGSVMAAIKTATVTGAAGVTADLSGAPAFTAFDASGTSGDNTVTVNADLATYTGGSGKDAVTLSSTTVDKAVSLGAGDDSLTLAAGTTALVSTMTGGDGTDTLVMAAADAATASVTTTFETKIDGFEKLSLLVATTQTVDLANMDDISYVISAGNGTALNIDNMAAGGTLELTAAGTLVDVDLVDATGTADAFNVVTKVGTADVNFGTLDLAGIETLHVTATDTSTKVAINTATMTLKDAALKTVHVMGNANATLVLDATVKALTSVDGSAMTGALNAATNGTVSQTILGGSGNDVLTAAGNADTLNGGAGNDTLTVTGDLTTLIGGAGADTFDIGNSTTNVNSYATITDLAAGDVIKFSATADAFAASKVSLAETAVFQDYANAAINATDLGDVAWFQFGGNTYVIEHASADASTSFVNGTDVIVKITGTVDLSTASFSSSADTLLIV